jgi:large subunit ribosomal protein L29
MAKNVIEMSGMTVEQLNTELSALRATYTDKKFNHAVQGLSNPMELRDHRRSVARYMTELRGREVALMTPEQLALRSKLRNRRKRGA